MSDCPAGAVAVRRCEHQHAAVSVHPDDEQLSLYIAAVIAATLRMSASNFDGAYIDLPNNSGHLRPHWLRLPGRVGFSSRQMTCVTSGR